MANRRCLHALTRHASSLVPRSPSLRFIAAQRPLKSIAAAAGKLASLSPGPEPTRFGHWSQTRHFSSNRDDGDSEEDDDDLEDGEEEEEEDWESSDGEGVSPPSGVSKRDYTPEEKAAEAAAIGYRVIGPLEESDGVFKPYEPVFAIVQIGSHQFKVSNGDAIFTERLKFCEVNDKLILDKVLMLGSSSQTIIGRPTVPDGTVHAVVEEHALDAKVLIFKKKRRKNYRRTKGHRQELTKLRITDIQGIEKPATVDTPKPPKTPGKKQEKVAVAA